MPSQKNNITRALELLFGKAVIKLKKNVVHQFWFKSFGESPGTLRKLCITITFPNQEIR